MLDSYPYIWYDVLYYTNGGQRMHGFWRAALYAAALGVLAHPVGQALPRRWFDPHQAPYRCRDWEKGGRVYNKLHIRRWKDRLPDMSRLMPDMVKKKLSAADPMSLVQETCVAECVHCWLIVLSVCGHAIFVEKRVVLAAVAGVQPAGQRELYPDPTL